MSVTVSPRTVKKIAENSYFMILSFFWWSEGGLNFKTTFFRLFQVWKRWLHWHWLFRLNRKRRSEYAALKIQIRDSWFGLNEANTLVFIGFYLLHDLLSNSRSICLCRWDKSCAIAEACPLRHTQRARAHLLCWWCGRPSCGGQL